MLGLTLFMAKYIDIQAAFVRSPTPPQVSVPGLQHQLSVRFRVDTFPSVGCDLTRDTCPDTVMAGVTVRLGVRPSTSDTGSPHNQNVELVISTPGIRSG